MFSSSEFDRALDYPTLPQHVGRQQRDSSEPRKDGLGLEVSDEYEIER
jgi:hypothetical protein